MQSDLYKSGKVTRWHQQPQIPAQTLADHQWGVVMILMTLSPHVEPSTIKYAMTHDVGELVSGDISGLVKTLHGEYGEMSNRVCDEHTRLITGKRYLPENRSDAKLVDICDKLEAQIYVSWTAPSVLRLQPWVSAIKRLYGRIAEMPQIHPTRVDLVIDMYADPSYIRGVLSRA